MSLYNSLEDSFEGGGDSRKKNKGSQVHSCSPHTLIYSFKGVNFVPAQVNDGLSSLERKSRPSARRIYLLDKNFKKAAHAPEV